MEAETHSDPQVAAYLKDKFVNVRLKVEDHRDLSKKFGIPVTPYSCLVDLDVEIVARLDGFLASKDYLPRLRRTQKRFEDYLKAADETGPSAQRRLADAMRRLDKFAKAGALYQKLLEPLQNSNDLTDEQKLDRAQIRAGLLDLTLRMPGQDRSTVESQLKTLREEDPQNRFESLDDVIATEMLMKYAKRDFESVVATARTAAGKYPDSDKADSILYLLGMAQNELGRKEESVKTFRDLLRRYPDGDASELARLALEPMGER